MRFVVCASSNVDILVILLLSTVPLYLDATPAIPSLVEEPVDTVASYNGVDGLILSATLRCQGNPRALEISWYKDDQEINMAGIPYFNVSDGWLTVGTRDKSDDDLAALEGFYFCTVSNSLGTVRSRKALIKGEKVKDFTRGNSANYYLNESVVLLQHRVLKLPVPDSSISHLWTVTCNSKSVDCSSVDCPFWQHSSTSGRLLVSSVLRFNYNEMKTQITGCDTSSSIRIKSLQSELLKFTFNGAFKPKAHIKSQTVSVAAGNIATLYCLSGDPNSRYTWTHNGSNINISSDNRYSLIEDGILKITGVVDKDSGQYKCQYNFPTFLNSGQTRTTSANLIVYSLPTVNFKLTATESDKMDKYGKSCSSENSSTMVCDLTSSKSVNITCVAQGPTPLAVQLINNGQVLQHESNTNYVQHTIDKPSAGIYQCMASNEYGNRQTTIYVSLPDIAPTVSSLSSSLSSSSSPSSSSSSSSYSSSPSSSSSLSSSSPLSFSSSVSSTSPLLPTTSTSHVRTSQGASQETTFPTASTGHTSTSQGSASQKTTLPTASTSHESTSQGNSEETSTNATPPISTSVTSQTDSTSSIFVAATNSTSNLLCNCESSNGWKIAAALGWTFSAILLCVCITLMWFHYGKNKHKATIPHLNRTSRENDETVVTRNPAYSAVAMWQDRSIETTAHYEDVEPC